MNVNHQDLRSKLIAGRKASLAILFKVKESAKLFNSNRGTKNLATYKAFSTDTKPSPEFTGKGY
jgi:hypothetical protein